ncbi:MAG: M67 family metallopeptidase [Phycisphaerales bacterium]|nr:M67 family metallopeptidase [Phycisphaerales bacterium]
MAVKVLTLTKIQAEQIEQEGVAAYPNECCGILIGREEGERRIVERLKPAGNAFAEDEKYHRFSISPAELMEADKEAGAAGKLVLGFYHSHPDHPARPSEYDRQHAWPFYSYVIVAIAKREAKQMTSWVLNEVSEQFEEQFIERG